MEGCGSIGVRGSTVLGAVSSGVVSPLGSVGGGAVVQRASLGFTSIRAARDGTVLEYQASHEMSGGRIASEVVGRNIRELLPPAVSSAISAAITACLDSQSVVNLDYTLELSDDVRAREARFAPAGTDEVVAIISDVTEAHIVEARQVHLAEILEASTDYVATTDLNGRILYANAAFRTRFGVATVEQIVSDAYSLFGFMSPQSRARFLGDGVPELWRTGRWSGEIEGLGADGSLIPLWQAAIAHLDATGKPEYFSGIARDISQMKVAQTELRVSEERFRSLLANGSDVILVLTAGGDVTYASPAIERVLGYPVDSLVGTTAFELIHPDDIGTALDSFAAAFNGMNSPNGLQYRVRHADGSWRWVESRATNHLDTPGVRGFIVNARDITVRHDANELIEQASALLASVMGAATNEAIFVTDSTATIVAFSRGAEVLLGFRADEVIGVLHPSVFHRAGEVATVADDLGISSEALFLHAPPDGRSIVREWEFVRRDGSTFDGALTVSARFDSAGVLSGFLYVASDISERRRRDADLSERALHDPLTGLANRAFLHGAFAEAVGESGWSEPGRIVLFIDLDHFKRVNDTFGHAAGDAVLVGVSERLKENLRSTDLPVRLGGDEFVVLLGRTASRSTATDIAERIVVALGRPFQIDGTDVTIGASVGLAISGPDLTADALMVAADAAAYEAKRTGKGRLVETAS